MENKIVDWLTRGSYFRFNALNIFYLKEGRGPALLVFHGYPYNGLDFSNVLKELAARFTVVIPDMPGMGFSDKPQHHSYAFAEMADIYTALVSHLGVGDVHILSHDLGNSVVQELIARDQERRNPFNINSIVFLNGGLFADVYRPRLIQVMLSRSPKVIGRVLSRVMTQSMVSKATSEVFGKHTKPSTELLRQFWAVLNYNDGKAIAYLLGRLIFEKDKHQQRWIESMQRTLIPMCFINGPADPNSGIHMANRYRELIPNAIVFLLSDNVGHWPQIEAPLEMLKAFHLFHQQVGGK